MNILSQIQHPWIFKIYEYFEQDKHLLIVTDPFIGMELFDFLTEDNRTEEEKWKTEEPLSLTEDVAARIMKSLLGCVGYCHQKNIVHRHLQPESIRVH